jgi:hypothetical protein
MEAETTQANAKEMLCDTFIYSVKRAKASRRALARVRARFSVRRLGQEFERIARPGRKEAEPAGGAPIGGSMQHSPEPAKPAFCHVLPADPLEVQVSASRAMGIENEAGRNTPGVEPRLALAASPGPHSQKSTEKVRRPMAMRAPAVHPTAIRTNQWAPCPTLTPRKHRPVPLVTATSALRRPFPFPWLPKRPV